MSSVSQKSGLDILQITKNKSSSCTEQCQDDDGKEESSLFSPSLDKTFDFRNELLAKTPNPRRRHLGRNEVKTPFGATISPINFIKTYSESPLDLSEISQIGFQNEDFKESMTSSKDSGDSNNEMNESSSNNESSGDSGRDSG